MPWVRYRPNRKLRRRKAGKEFWLRRQVGTHERSLRSGSYQLHGSQLWRAIFRPGSIFRRGYSLSCRRSRRSSVKPWTGSRVASLMVAESRRSLVLALLTWFSTVVDALLREWANFYQTPNPSKAPWYFSVSRSRARLPSAGRAVLSR